MDELTEKITEGLKHILDNNYNHAHPLNDLKKYVPEKYLIRYKKGETMIYQGDVPDFIYIILSGKAKIQNDIPWATNEVSDLAEQLFILGLIEHLNQLNYYTGFVTAKSSCDVLRIPADLFISIIKTDVEVCYKVMTIMGFMMSHNMYLAETNSVFHSKDRLGHYLYLQALKADATPYLCPETRENIAEELHINIRTLYRHIQTMKEDGYIKLVKGKILVTQQGFEKLRKQYGKIVLKSKAKTK